MSRNTAILEHACITARKYAWEARKRGNLHLAAQWEVRLALRRKLYAMQKDIERENRENG